jgi:predicted cupin superfamily sugar epimerase
MHPRARELLESLRLEPHPEGGHYRRIWTSAHCVESSDRRGPRAAMSAIHFLLDTEEVSRWHRVASDEAWLHVEGSGVRLHLLDWASRELRSQQVGPADQGGVPVCIVPAGTWQAAQPVGAFALVTCVVAPEFAFEDFQLMAADGAEARWLAGSAPGMARFVR